jgi:hypothetical protein
MHPRMTNFGTNIGGGEARAGGSARLRLDYRTFRLTGDPPSRESSGSTAGAAGF